ncbi:MAG: DNA mismatch repair protein MutS [Defluviitaleaceae bacterium]|nr:DNA mismatch repair protein MutS [Defluviitaleaceae bacterium]
MKWSPMMLQYFKIKESYKDDLVFFRLGDFYELFFDDAVLVSEALGLHLTKRDTGQGKAPMCGIPHHSAEGYIRKLAEMGHRVALCEQMGEVENGIMKRQVVRVYTPGTLFAEENDSWFIASIMAENSGFGLAYVDVSTGDFYATTFENRDKLIDEIAKIAPAELILGDGFKPDEFDIPAKTYHFWIFLHTAAWGRLADHFGEEKLQSFGGIPRPAISAAGALLEYLRETQQNSLSHISKLNLYSSATYMPLDRFARRNLELFETLGGERKGSLLWVLDDTKTPMGGRLLKKWMMSPLVSLDDINTRQASVAEYAEKNSLREQTRSILSKVGDLERFCGKITYNQILPRDILSLEKSLKAIKGLPTNLTASLNTYFSTEMDKLTDIYEKIADAISVDDGKVFAQGFDPNLDDLRRRLSQSLNEIDNYQNSQREATGIKSLKVSQNKVFGYYIEVPNSSRDKVPKGYTARQTLANHQRYTSEELKSLETQVLMLTQEVADLEEALFARLKKELSAEGSRIQETAHFIANIDALQSLGEIACKYNYTAPKLNTEGVLDIKGGRHPVIERLFEGFVPNDLLMGENRKIAVITGPNMAGKSTYMRQTALIQIMAQMGSFIPADSANLAICDQIFTRVGAADDLSRGQSTFMVEMAEVAHIIANATANSLILLDEVGRGTGTMDGLAIATAVLEHIAEEIGAKTMFATHYHELTATEGHIPGAFNLSMVVEEDAGNIRFLWKVTEGGTDKSHGINVAKIAGLPISLVERAMHFMESIEIRGVYDEQTLTKEQRVDYQVAKEVMRHVRMHLEDSVLFGDEIFSKKDMLTMMAIKEREVRASIES